MAHQGLREFTAEELSSIALGQNGFKIINNDDITCGVGGDAGFTHIEYFCALKITDADGEVEARSVTDGDDLTLASGGTADFASPTTVVNGDIIYGAFDRVEASASTYIIAYIGKLL